VVFAHHLAIIAKLVESFPQKSVVITGETSEQDRQMAISRFNENDNINLFISSIRAGGVGITLTVASNVVFIESGWSPAENEQAEDRVHRIGQDADCVNIYYLVGKDTIDMSIHDLIYTKENMISQIHKKNELDGGKTIDEIVSSLNANLNPLGLKVVYDIELMKDSLSLHVPEWMTLKQAEEFARSQKSKILKTNLMDDMKKGRISKSETAWIPQKGARGGYWLIKKETVLRRITERRRGKGRPKKAIKDQVSK
jgi:superfamily II DNA/RNA helicase